MCIYIVYTSYIFHIFMVYTSQVHAYNMFFAVASRNNDRTVSGKAYAWRLLGMMSGISKAATVAQTSEWRAERRIRLNHSCIDILVAQINDLTSRDIHIRYADKMVRRSRVFMDFLSMDGDEVSTTTMCPTTQSDTVRYLHSGSLMMPKLLVSQGTVAGL
jgi:hypothetical protein